MPTDAISIDRQVLESFCRRHRIQRLSLFGSVLRDDFREDSDVDVLVEFEPGVVIGWDVVVAEEELAAILNRPVDLRTEGDLSRHIRQSVIEEARELYVAA
jgi:predicted nucleotidyltransferase